ncbi:glycoside hydrolase family 6 protein [Micromonospora viridifaciens]|uniref:glycoside hydrolase family 6 protein n=1 Tax=Micromonospora viridifaciens TaxID=1881 RepID=UPI000B5AE06B|nr:glycoside hydrolase family 6 protein [Micromonospora viridifaciens]
MPWKRSHARICSTRGATPRVQTSRATGRRSIFPTGRIGRSSSPPPRPSGSGNPEGPVGERPKAAPEAGIGAYVWIKPPGESDGSSSEIPNDEGKVFDRMCDPTYTGNARNGNNPSGALPNAPVSGHWFSAQFQELTRNAYPPLS